MAYISVLDEMTKTMPTQFWNDNCALADLSFAIKHGAVGATTNPVIVGQVLEAELDAYVPKIKEIAAKNPTATEDEVAWKLNEYMAVEGAKMLGPVFEREGGRAGFISIQTNAKFWRTASSIVEQAVGFSGLAPNMMVKMPVTSAGVSAIEESTYRGVNVNATVSYCVPQAVAVAEAIARGMKRREAEGLDNSGLYPVCTIMVGRLEDYLRTHVSETSITVSDEALGMAGAAVFKEAYRIYKERGYHTRLLAAAYRSNHHLTEIMGGDVSMTIPPAWIRRFVDSDIKAQDRIGIPVEDRIMEELLGIPDFVRSYRVDGMGAQEFDTYGPVRQTLLQFLNGYDSMVGMIRKVMLEA